VGTPADRDRRRHRERHGEWASISCGAPANDKVHFEVARVMEYSSAYEIYRNDASRRFRNRTSAGRRTALEVGRRTIRRTCLPVSVASSSITVTPSRT